MEIFSDTVSDTLPAVLRRNAGQQLRQLRNAHGLTRTQLGTLLGYGLRQGPSRVGQIEAALRSPTPIQRRALHTAFGVLPSGWDEADAIEAAATSARLNAEAAERKARQPAEDLEKAQVVALLLGLRGRVGEVLANPDACGVVLQSPFQFWRRCPLGALLLGMRGPLRIPGHTDLWMVGGLGSLLCRRGSLTLLSASGELTEQECTMELHHHIGRRAIDACLPQLPAHRPSRWTVSDAVKQLLGKRSLLGKRPAATLQVRRK